MAVATEVLNEDIKELKSEIKDIRSSLDVIKADVHRIDVSMSGLRAEFGFAKWLVGITLGVTLAGTANGIWTAATLTNEVKHQSSDMAELRKSLDGGRLVHDTVLKHEIVQPPGMINDTMPEPKRP